MLYITTVFHIVYWTFKIKITTTTRNLLWYNFVLYFPRTWCWLVLRLVAMVEMATEPSCPTCCTRPTAVSWRWLCRALRRVRSLMGDLASPSSCWWRAASRQGRVWRLTAAWMTSTPRESSRWAGSDELCWVTIQGMEFSTLIGWTWTNFCFYFFYCQKF